MTDSHVQPVRSTHPLAPSLKGRGKYRLGFSLTELLVVIGIIVLLMGILLVALGQVQKKARRTDTESRMRNFLNACASFQAEHGRYPGVIPDDVIVNNPSASGGPPHISSTENALLHLMGGYRVLSPSDDPANTASPIVSDYNGFVSTHQFTFGASGWALKVNTNKIGEGPVINGKPYAPYFTPGANDLAKAAGQLSDLDGTKIPDLIDAWGQPIIYIRQVRDRGPLLPDPAATTPLAPQFLMGGVNDYLNATTQPPQPGPGLGELGQDQMTSSILHVGTAAIQNSVFAVVLSHPAFYKQPPANNPLYSSSRGPILLLSPGPDGIYFSTKDGPGTEADPIDAADIDAKILQAGPKVIDEFDDIRIFGGG